MCENDDDLTLAEAINIAGYEIFANRFVPLHKRIPNVHSTQIKRFHEFLPSGQINILEIGVGTGRDVAQLSAPGVTYYGIDSSTKMINHVQTTNPKGIFSVQDVLTMNFAQESMDGVWAAAVLHHVTPRKLTPVLENIRMVLKTSGVAFLSIREGDGIWENPETGIIYWRWPLEIFKVILLLSGFKIIDAYVDSSRPDQKYLEIFCQKPPTPCQ